MAAVVVAAEAGVDRERPPNSSPRRLRGPNPPPRRSPARAADARQQKLHRNRHRLFQKLPLFGVPLSWKLLLCVVVFGGGLWLLRRMLSGHKTVDTLVEVEMELKKVSWPTRDESINATWVVILVTVLITFMLFGFDFGLRSMFNLIF